VNVHGASLPESRRLEYLDDIAEYWGKMLVYVRNLRNPDGAWCDFYPSIGIFGNPIFTGMAVHALVAHEALVVQVQDPLPPEEFDLTFDLPGDIAGLTDPDSCMEYLGVDEFGNVLPENEQVLFAVPENTRSPVSCGAQYTYRHELARERIYSELNSFPNLSVSRQTVLDGAGNDTGLQNIIATQLGTDPQLKNEVVIVGAHYDSGCGSPGADDNGSGSAGVLELASVLSEYPSRRTIKYIFFDNEEGTVNAPMGSEYFVENDPSALEHRIHAAVILDMIGYNDGNRVSPLPVRRALLYWISGFRIQAKH